MIGSPCVNVCQMNRELGLCIGCLRTLDEIARWSIMEDKERVQVLGAVVERRAVLGPALGASQPSAPAEGIVPADADRHPDRR